MKAFEQIESLMKSKAYADLNREERALVDQELGEEVYKEIRKGMTQLNEEKVPVKKDVKRMLMEELKAQSSPSWYSIFQRRLPAYIQVVGLMILVGIYYFIPAKEQIVVQDRMVEVAVRDTIRITQVDTLWVEKIVEVPTTVYVTQTVEKPVKLDIQPTNNLSLSDQKEVLDLVVRGLD